MCREAEALSAALSRAYGVLVCLGEGCAARLRLPQRFGLEAIEAREARGHRSQHPARPRDALQGVQIEETERGASGRPASCADTWSTSSGTAKIALSDVIVSMAPITFR